MHNIKKTSVIGQIHTEKVIAVIRADNSQGLIDCARALAAGGLNCIELTMTTPGAIEICRRLSEELPNILLGLGTVMDAKTARVGIAAGAKFIVTPSVRPNVIAACNNAGIPILGGAFTPTEIYTSWELGVDMVKVFPADVAGPAYIKSIKAIFPRIALMPTGGVTPRTLGGFLEAGAFAAAAGSALVSSAALKSRNWSAITVRARQFCKVASSNGHA